MMRVLLLRLLPLLALSLIPGPAFARQGATDGPEVAQMKIIEDNLKDARSQNAEKRAVAEEQIVQAIDHLLTEYPKLTPEKQKAVAGTMSKVFAARTVEDANRIYLAAAAAMSEMGPEGEAGILKAMKLQHIEKRVEVQATLIRALGKHKDEKQIDFLIKTLLKDESALVVAAAEALGEYRESDGKVRKKITEALVKEYVRTNSADVAAKGKDEVANDRIKAIEVQMNTSLEMMTLQRFSTAPEWEKWFNDNRSKIW